ncbi:fimbrial protein [Salmonella enterica]|nr:fimbrial protein [Salmonella enterica]
MKRSVQYILLVLAAFLVNRTGTAGTVLDTRTVMLQITVLNPTCDVKNGNTSGSSLDIDFGNVRQNLLPVTGGDISYKIVCTAATPPGKTLKMKLVPGSHGTVTDDSGNKVLATSNTGLGIFISTNRNFDSYGNFTPDEFRTVQLSGTFYSRLVKVGNITEYGEMQASASFVAEYQ